MPFLFTTYIFNFDSCYIGNIETSFNEEHSSSKLIAAGLHVSCTYPFIEMKIDLKELALRENERVEWKKSGDDKDVAKGIVKTLSAFANDIANVGGGYVVCGAEEGVDQFGFPTVNYLGLEPEKIKRISNTVTSLCLKHVRPSINPMITELANPTDPSTKVLIFTQYRTPDAHAYSDGEKTAHYVRIGNSTREASNGVLRQLLIKKQELEYFDERICQKATESDLDIPLFRDYMKEMGLWDSNKGIEAYFSDREQIAQFIPPLFETVKLEGILKPKNFSVLIFGKKGSISRLFPHAFINISFYNGMDRSEPTAERHRLVGTLIEQARKAISILESEAYESFDKLRDKPNQVKYPHRAIQEAVINAIVHRDYQVPEPIRITVFSDRIEIVSPGPLHWAVDQRKFLEGKVGARWRNRSFAYLFNKIQLAQGEGQGIPTILRTMREQGSPNPIFELGVESVVCTLPAHPRHQSKEQLQNIEEHIIFGELEKAQARLEAILEKDPYNSRALDLLVEISRRTGEPEILLSYLKTKQLNLELVDPNTLVNMAAILLSNSDKGEMKQLSEQAIKIAMGGNLRQGQILKTAASLQQLEMQHDAQRFLATAATRFPNLTNLAEFQEMQSDLKLYLAMLCIQSLQDPTSSDQIKDAARSKLKELTKEARQHLTLAMANAKESDALNDYQQKLLQIDQLIERWA